YMDTLQELLYENSFNPVENPVDETEVISHNLSEIIRVLKENHDGLFVEIVEDLNRKVQTFGCFFTTLDIRQDSSILRNTFNNLVIAFPKETGIEFENIDGSEKNKEKEIKFTQADLNLDNESDPLIIDTLKVVKLIREIQKSGSERARSEERRVGK